LRVSLAALQGGQADAGAVGARPLASRRPPQIDVMDVDAAAGATGGEARPTRCTTSGRSRSELDTSIPRAWIGIQMPWPDAYPTSAEHVAKLLNALIPADRRLQIVGLVVDLSRDLR